MSSVLYNFSGVISAPTSTNPTPTPGGGSTPFDLPNKSIYTVIFNQSTNLPVLTLVSGKPVLDLSTSDNGQIQKMVTSVDCFATYVTDKQTPVMGIPLVIGDIWAQAGQSILAIVSNQNFPSTNGTVEVYYK